ncbi:hypothetical protein FRC17_006709, partial [Serendipita sp. 399]
MSNHPPNSSSPVVEPDGAQDGDASPSTSNDARKELSTAVVACRQCRARKYDAVPKRRGPDRQPGTRKRLYKKKPEGLTTGSTSPQRQRSAPSEDGDTAPPRRTKRIKQIENLNPASPKVSTSIVEHPNPEVGSRTSLPPAVVRIDDADLDVTIRQAGFGTLSHLLWQTTAESQFFTNDGLDHDSNLEDQLVPIRPQTYVDSIQGARAILGLVSVTDGSTGEPNDDQEDAIPRGPSSSFNRQTWWDSLLPLYSNNPSDGARKIMQDLKFL